MSIFFSLPSWTLLGWGQVVGIQFVYILMPKIIVACNLKMAVVCLILVCAAEKVLVKIWDLLVERMLSGMVTLFNWRACWHVRELLA